MLTKKLLAHLTLPTELIIRKKHQCPRFKACAKMESLKNVNSPQKSPSSQGNQNTYNQNFDVSGKTEISCKNIINLPKYARKYLGSD